jgi:hypothetical protein
VHASGACGAKPKLSGSRANNEIRRNVRPRPAPAAGEWVLRNRPAAVVVETACHPGHGAWPGNLFSCADQVVLGAGGGFFQRVFCQVGPAGAFDCAAAAVSLPCEQPRERS